jgi:thiol-disulfide isomerase/thioredoxin
MAGGTSDDIQAGEAESESGARPRRAYFRSMFHRQADAPDLPIEGPLPGFEGATGWLGSGPLTPEGLRGRVVLVDFWTYTCINWLRTLPYLRAWHAKYERQGLTIVGVHTPEFAFERKEPNVVPRAREFGVDYPIALDADYGVWDAFGNHYWPAAYIADAEGRIRYHHYGEGEYAMTEMVIQRLLGDAGATGFSPDLVSVQPAGFEVPADWESLRSPEAYLNSARGVGLTAPNHARLDEAYDYPAPGELRLNGWSPVGRWTVAGDASVLHVAGGRIAFRFQARDVNLVMGPASAGSRVPFRVHLDGQPPGSSHGFDVEPDGSGWVADQRLYQLIRQAGRAPERLVEIEFLEAGVAAYCFTFG